MKIVIRYLVKNYQPILVFILFFLSLMFSSTMDYQNESEQYSKYSRIDFKRNNVY